jgi:hypothetical protein
MSSLDERRARYCSKLICVAYASASVAALVAHDARAAVFEQRCSGKVIAIAGGAPVGAPPRKDTSSSGGQAAVATSVLEFGPPAGAAAADVPAGVALAAEGSPPSFACANPPAGTTGKGVLALKAITNDPSLPGGGSPHQPWIRKAAFGHEFLQLDDLPSVVLNVSQPSPDGRMMLQGGRLR